MTTTPTPTRSLGDGLTVSPLGLGCMSMSAVYGPGDEDSAMATFDRAIELGVTFFDTADIYGATDNERIVGNALRSRRDDVIIATKFAIQWNADGTRAVNGRPEYVRQACDASLQRLGIDTIDVYYQHRVDTSIPIEETLGGDERPRRRRQGAPPRHLRAVARVVAPGRRRPPDRRPAERVVAVEPRHRDRDRAAVPSAGDRHRALQPPRTGLPHG